MKNYIKIFAVAIVLFFTTQNAFAQPANDVCSGAQSVTPDGSCVAGTTVAAGDHWTGTVGCAGNNVEVWYSFVATGTQLDIVVTNGTMTGNIEFVLVSSTGPCAGLALNGSSCGASPLAVTASTSLTIGVTYYYTISSTGSEGTFTTCVTSSTPPPTPGQDCPTASVLCSATDFSIGSLASGVGAISGDASNENLSALGCLLSDERQSQWYTFTVDQTGSFEFMLSPNVASDDYDWAIFDITTSGCALTPGGSAAGGATQVACDYSGCSGTTGLSDNPNVNFGTSGGLAVGQWQNNNPPGFGTCVGGPFQWNPAITLTAGQTYAFVIDNFSATNSGFNLTFGATNTAAVGQDGSFTYIQDATCMKIDVTLTGYTGANSTYLWNYGDGATSTSSTPPVHTYGATGSFTVSLTVTDAVGCTQTFSEVVDVGCVLPIKLTSFTAKYNGSTTDIKWETASEINNDFFTVERSADGKIFEVVGIVDGAGNSNTVLNYDLEDENPQKGISYYRLKQTDFDGKFEYSDIVAVSVKANIDGISVYPNPVTNNGHLTFNADRDGQFDVTIYDVTGRKVLFEKYTVEEGANNIEMPTSNLKQGMYFIYIGNDKEQTNIKFIKE